MRFLPLARQGIRTLHLPSARLILSVALSFGVLETGAAAPSADRLQALYVFDEGEGTTVKNRSGAASPLDLTIAEPNAVRWTEKGLQLIRSTRIVSTQPVFQINEAVRRSGEITVEAWITPAKLNQEGPARIVTVSQNSTQRNFTLGQEDDTYDFRFRTTDTSDNGLPSTRSPRDSVTLRPTQVVVTRNRDGLVRFYLDGQLRATKQVKGSTQNWQRNYHLTLGNERNGDRAWLGWYRMLAIYSRSLLPEEIEARYRAGPEAVSPLAAAVNAPSPNETLFTTRIASILADRCLECHDAATRKGKLDLSRKDAALAGGSGGPVIVPGKPEESYMLETVLTDEMPKKRDPLSTEEKDLLAQWIREGAHWPIEFLDPAAFVHGGKADENWLRRLTLTEYVQSVQAAVGIDISEEAVQWLPPDLRADGFSNTAYNLQVDLKHVNAYARLAAVIVSRMDIDAFARKFSNRRLLTDDHMRSFIEKMGKRLLRGPLDSDEIDSYRGISTTVAASGGDFRDAVALIIDAMLQSPRFLYRMENQRGDGSRWTVSEYELASRMSYILWGAPPDGPLFEAAESGELFTDAGLETQIDRMLEDPRTVKRSRQFLSEWLDLNRLDHLRPHPDRFPNWTAELAAEMKLETQLFFEDLVWKQRRPLRELYNAQFTWATPRLAAYYGLPSNEGETPQRYDLSEIPERGGLLTQGSLLTVGGDEASMVTRGLFVLHDLLRGVVKDPPPCVNTTPVPTAPGLTQRAIAEQRIADQQCGGCHGKIEPLAFGLERFDGTGAYRKIDEHGNPLREDGQVIFPGSDRILPYAAATELMRFLAEGDRPAETITWKLTQFALGRPLIFADAPAVDKIHRAAQKEGGTYQALIAEIIKSDLVRTIPTEKTP